MGKALYRKYRSKKLSEIVGQEHVTTALENALKKGRIGHAYLFTGPRGVGKTSIARILAHEVNQLPYDEDATHLDIIEIDAASNRRIDEIRSLRERVHNAPTSAKYKVYIIDEVHMLTKEAFNALLKTLEEPPAHVIFILATTEVHRLPETIVSRTQRYSFRPAEQSAAVKHLKAIAKSEKMQIDDEALELIADHGRGSFRDSISLLDQIGNSGDKITADDVRRSLGIAPDAIIQELISLLSEGTPQQVIATLKDLHSQGYQAPQIAKQLGQMLRQSVLNDTPHINPGTATKLMQQLIDVPAAHDPFTLLEVILLEPVLSNTQPANTASEQPPTQATDSKQEPTNTQQHTERKNSEPQGQKDSLSSRTEDSPSAAAKEPDARPEPKQSNAQVDAPRPVTSAGHTILNEDSWQQVLGALKQNHNTLYGIARMAVPLFTDSKLTLCFSFPFHQKRFNDPKNTKILSTIIHEQTGSTVAIECIVDKNATPLPTAPIDNSEPASSPDQPSAALDTISNIFGGGEILE